MVGMRKQDAHSLRDNVRITLNSTRILGVENRGVTKYGNVFVLVAVRTLHRHGAQTTSTCNCTIVQVQVQSTGTILSMNVVDLPPNMVKFDVFFRCHSRTLVFTCCTSDRCASLPGMKGYKIPINFFNGKWIKEV
jgi:hypothetical protein